MVIQNFASKVVFLDTAPLIYFIEGHSTYQTILSRLFDFNGKGGFSFATSTITLLEVLVKPLREGANWRCQTIQRHLDNSTGHRNI